MSIQVHSVLNSINQYNQLQKTNRSLQQQLSTGKRINSPADNPFLFNRIRRFTSEISISDTYLNNMNEGITAISMATEATSQQLNGLQKMLELANQASANGVSQNERNELNTEYEKLYEELNEIVENSTFNTQKLLDGSFAETGIMITTGPAQNYELIVGDTTTEGLELSSHDSITSKQNASQAVTAIESAIDTITQMQSGFGTDEFIIESRAGLLESKQTSLENLIQNYQEVDLLKVASQLDQNKILEQFTLAAISSAFDSQQTLVDYLFPRR